MSSQSSKKLPLKRETLRSLETTQVAQLDDAVGGTTPTIIVHTVIVYTVGVYTQKMD
ncbi:hypothetical protein ACLESO_27740 [Pyxidicoccus sp. 3LG]